MRVLTTLLALLLLTTLTSCRVGSNPAKSAVADSPFGARASLEFTDSGKADFRAELLAVTEDGLLYISWYPASSISARARVSSDTG